MTRIPGGSQPTSALGFGCAALSAGSSRRHSIALVHEACAAGITHFDTAPPYGMGTAEDVLGEALKDRRDRVTLTTKVGISRPRHGRAVMYARGLAAPLRKLLPQLTRRVGASAYSGLTQRPQLAIPFVQASLADSLRRLKTDYLDLLLLHEVTLDDLTSEVLDLLDALRRQGVGRAIGIGTSYQNTLAIRTRHAAFFDVWQYSWSAFDSDQQQPVPFTVTHRAIQRALAPLRELIRRDPAQAERLSDAAGFDLAVDENLALVLIGAAMAHNPEGITLTASRHKGRIAVNARVMSEPRYCIAGQRLTAALAAKPERVRA